MKKIKGYESVLKMTQPQLKAALDIELRKYYKDVINKNGFLYAKGSRILITAHMDTVHKEPVREIMRFKDDGGDTVLCSPQGLGCDDRNGVWAIVKILRTTQFRPSILFCEDEEIGSVGATKFVKTKYADDLKDMLYLLELDRRGSEDAVFYECGNKEFQNYICEMTGNKKESGTFSDICELSPKGDVASVNLSCGYYKEHHPETYTIVEEMNAMIEKVEWLLEDEKNVTEKFKYEENTYDYYLGRSYSRYGFDYGDWYDDDVYVILYGNDHLEKYETEAVSDVEAIGYFLMENPDKSYNDVQWIGHANEYSQFFTNEEVG